MQICKVCNRPVEKCICCPECGHICDLDRGENYCPVCFPKVMPDNDETFMRQALEEAEKALGKSEVPVGAILVIDGQIISRAHNMRESTNDPTAHAEMLVLREATTGIRNWRLNNATVYVTKEPCVMCTGAMINARLKRLVYGCRDTKYGAVDSQFHLLSDNRLNHRVDVTSGVLEDECSRLLRDFFRELRTRNRRSSTVNGQS